MNILQITTFTGGGAGIACLRLHQALLEAGMASKVLCLDGDLTSPGVYSFRRRSITFAARAGQKLREKWYANRLRQLTANKEKPFERLELVRTPYRVHEHPLVEWADVVNLHWVARFVDYPSFFRQVNKPIVWTIHDLLPFSGGYHYEVGFPIDSYSALLKTNLEKKRKALRNIPISVVVLNKWMERMSQASELFREYPHSLIRNSVNTHTFRLFDKQFAKKVFQVPPDKTCLLFVADSVQNKRKGFQYLLEALQQIDREDVALLVVGGQATGLSGLSGIHVLGRINDDRLLSLAYNAADAFIIPSIEDNLPNTILESLACGTPVIGFPIGGIPDIVIPGFNGILAGDVSTNALKNAIISLVDNASFDREAIAAAAEQEFSPVLQAAKYRKLYEQHVLSQNN